MGSRGGLTGWFRKRYDRAADNVATAPIVARVLGAIGVLAILVAAAFAFVLVALSNLRGSTNEQVTANRVTTAAPPARARGRRARPEPARSRPHGKQRIRANWETARRSLAPAIIALEKQADSQRREVPLVRSVAVQARALRFRLRQPDPQDRRGGPGGGAVADDDARGPDPDRPAPPRSGPAARRRGPARLQPRFVVPPPGQSGRADRRHRARHLRLPAPARQRLPRARRRASGPHRRERSLADRRRRSLDAHPGGRPGGDPRAHDRVQHDGGVGGARAARARGPERAAPSERAREVGADHDRLPRAADSARRASSATRA